MSRKLVSPHEEPCYLRLYCFNCGNPKVVYSHSTTKLSCGVCRKEIVLPKGGKAILKGWLEPIEGIDYPELPRLYVEENRGRLA